MAALGGLAVAVASVTVAAVMYGPAGDLAALAVLLGTVPAVLAAGAVVRRDPPGSTVADRVTLTRAALACGCAAVAVLVLAGAMPGRTWLLVVLAAPTLALDAVDGQVARRTGSVTAAGARLDQEVDAGVLVVLSLAVAPVLGAWVLLIGALRYLFFAAARLRPALAAPLARSEFRRVVAGLQGAMLTVAIAPVVPIGAGAAAVGLALTLLLWSFGRDVLTLEARARSARASGSSAGASTGVPRPPSRASAAPDRVA